jgi:hypothetical protein
MRSSLGRPRSGSAGAMLGGTRVILPVERIVVSTCSGGFGSLNSQLGESGGSSTWNHQCWSGVEPQPLIISVPGSSNEAARRASMQFRATTTSPLDWVPLRTAMLLFDSNRESTSSARTRMTPRVGEADRGSKGIAAKPRLMRSRAADRASC